MIWPWLGFSAFILLMLALDLGLLQRRPHVIGMREALAWFAVWTGLAILFNIGVIVFHERGVEAGLEFFTGFLVEKSLSIDNVFVFILIFGYFHVPQAYQHKVLFWGIIGAIVLRVIFIVGGLALMERFHWTIYLFGTFLLGTGIAMMLRRESKYDPEKNLLVRTFRRFFPVTDRYDGNRFFTRVDGRLMATPLFIVLLAVESSDIIFAVDSIPAIFAITPDPFIVFTSNIFAMLGLRALYFAVSGFMQMFHFLHYGFASIIAILGVKMLLSEVYKIPVAASLVLIIVVLLVCVIISLLRPRKADLKLLFERTESRGLIPFRRLLLIENVIDLGHLHVRHAMRGRGHVSVVRLDEPWDVSLKTMRQTRYSRFPVVGGNDATPRTIVHVKDLVFNDTSGAGTDERLGKLGRPCMEMSEELPLEEALVRFQGRGEQMAIVVGAASDWTGIITIEDVLEEIVGKIGDEFDHGGAAQPVSLADSLHADRIVLELRADSMDDAIEKIIAAVPQAVLPIDAGTITQSVIDRERAMTTYLGKGLAIPHARLDGLTTPVLIFARSDEGVPLESTNERAELIFVLLTPSGVPRVQVQLLADIAALFDSEYVTERLRKARTPEALIEAIRAGQQVAID